MWFTTLRRDWIAGSAGATKPMRREAGFYAWVDPRTLDRCACRGTVDRWYVPGTDRQGRRRDVDGAVGGDGPRHPRRLLRRWPAHGRSARRVQRRTGRQQLGDGGPRDE